MNKWLEKYSNGDIVQQNYNDVSVSLPEGFVGMGYNTKGRNYSPAWGGQFEEGGALTKAQKGKTLPPILTDDPRKVQAYSDTTIANQSTELLLNALKQYNKNPTDKNKKKYWKAQDENTRWVSKFTPTNNPQIGGVGAGGQGWTTQNAPDGNPDYFFTFKKAVQPYILQKEPSLKKKVTKAELLKSDRTAFNPQITQLQNQSINLPTIQNLPYRVEYYDGDINGMTHKNFIDEKAGSEFMKELQNRSYGIPYGVQAYYENTPKKENGGWLNQYQGGGEEPLTKSSADWYRQWYEQRQALPQFSRVAGERLKLLSTLPKVQLTPLEELQKFGAVGEYIKNRGDDASQDIISLADPATVPAYAEKIGKSIDVNVGTDPSVVGHEMSHWFDARAKQSMFKPRNSKSEPYEKYPFIKPSSFKKSGLDSKTYNWISGDDNPEVAAGVKTELNSVLNELREKEGLRGDQSTTPEQLQKIIDKYMNLSEDDLRKSSPKGNQNQRIRTLIKYMGGDPEKLSELNNTIVAIQKEDVPIAKHGGWLSKYDEGGEISPNCDTNALYHPITNPCGYKLKLTPGLLGNTTQQITQPYNSSNFREQPLANSNSYIQQQQLQRFNNTKRVEDNKLKNKILNQPQLRQAKEETPYERERRTALNSSYVGSNQYAALDDNGNITNRIPGIDITGKVYDSKAVRQERMKPLIAAGAIAALPAVVSAAAPYVAATSAALNAPLLGTLGAEYGSAALTTNNLINAYFAYEGIKNIPKVVDDWKEVGKSPTLDNVGNATSSTLLSALGILPFTSGVIKGIPSVIQDFNQAGKYLTEETALKNAYKLNPYAFKPNSEAYYRMIGKEGYKDALESGVVRPPQTTRIFDQGTQEYKNIPIPQFEEAYYNAQYPLDRRWYPNNIKKTNPEKAAIAKKSGYQGPYMAEVTGEYQLFENGENVASYFGPNSSRTVTYSKEHIPITNPNLKLYKQDWLKGYKEVPKKEKGGVVKDDMGYWNPDNHGKVVEIDSNDITMEGVDQPLIGISDEGDQQYMLPGKNYKFKGKKVREYPVAKNGVRQEQKGLQNLDDLLNFTNYNKPQPGGWLNKYN